MYIYPLSPLKNGLKIAYMLFLLVTPIFRVEYMLYFTYYTLIT